MNIKDYWHERWRGKEFHPTSGFAKRAAKYIHEKGLNKVLDLGSGNGRDAIYFLKKGLDVTALDIAPSAIDALLSAYPSIEGIAADITNYELPKNFFDVIYANLSLHYFDDVVTQKIFNNVYSSLKKGGLFFVRCKSVEDELYGKGTLVENDTFVEEHLRHFFSKDYMRKKLYKFDILKIRRSSSIHKSHNREDYVSSFVEAVACKRCL